jgi:hypothetical protein
LRDWDAEACAEFVNEGCGLPKYTTCFHLNIKSGKSLLSLDANRLCAVGVQSLSDQQLILEKIRKLREVGFYKPRSGSHLSWRQQLSGALHGHKEHVAAKHSLAPLAEIKTTESICVVKASFDQEGEMSPAFKPNELPQVRKQLAKRVPKMTPYFTGRVEEESWTNSNGVAQFANMYIEVKKETRNIIDENYEVSKSSMRNNDLSRDRALANRHKRGQVEVQVVKEGEDIPAHEARKFSNL